MSRCLSSSTRTANSVLALRMTKIDEIISAVEQLTPEELALFRAWFEELEARLWDEQIERDAKAGKLDKLAERALADHKAGKSIKFR